MDITNTLDSINIAKELGEEQLKKIGADCARGYKTDLGTRKEWEENQ